jgi:hypothetical protein
MYQTITSGNAPIRGCVLQRGVLACSRGEQASLSVHHEKEKLMELTVAKPQEEKVDFAVLYGGKILA